MSLASLKYCYNTASRITAYCPNMPFVTLIQHFAVLVDSCMLIAKTVAVRNLVQHLIDTICGYHCTHHHGALLVDIPGHPEVEKHAPFDIAKSSASP